MTAAIPIICRAVLPSPKITSRGTRALISGACQRSRLSRVLRTEGFLAFRAPVARRSCRPLYFRGVFKSLTFMTKRLCLRRTQQARRKASTRARSEDVQHEDRPPDLRYYGKAVSEVGFSNGGRGGLTKSLHFVRPYSSAIIAKGFPVFRRAPPRRPGLLEPLMAKASGNPFAGMELPR